MNTDEWAGFRFMFKFAKTRNFPNVFDLNEMKQMYG